MLDCAGEEPSLADWLSGQLGRAAVLAGAADAQLGVAVVDDEAMIDLHRRYHGLDSTTDVLTFDLRDDPDGPVEGEIVVCRDEARRQAAERGHPVEHEMLLYAVHGLMHLLGEDDHDAEAFDHMHRREDDLLEALGLGRLFGGDPATPGAGAGGRP